MPKPKPDLDNFEFKLFAPDSEFHVVMTVGRLMVNDVSYDEDKYDPTYAAMREIALLRGIVR